jgi:hypothetical protein
MVNTAGSAGYCYQQVATEVDGIYCLTFWHKNLATIQGMLRLGTTNSGNQIYSPPAFDDPFGNLVFIPRTVTFRALGVDTFIRLVINSLTATQGTLWDQVSLKRAEMASTMALLATATSNVQIKANWTIAAGTQAGVVARANSRSQPTSYLVAFHDGTNAHLWWVSNGVITPLINTAAPGASPEIRCSGTTVQLFCGDVQVGTNKTVDDPAINNNVYHGLYDPSGVNGCASLSITNFP